MKTYRTITLVILCDYNDPNNIQELAQDFADYLAEGKIWASKGSVKVVRTYIRKAKHPPTTYSKGDIE